MKDRYNVGWLLSCLVYFEHLSDNQELILGWIQLGKDQSQINWKSNLIIVCITLKEWKFKKHDGIEITYIKEMN